MRWVSPRTIRGNRGDLLSRAGLLSHLAGLGTGEIQVFADRGGDLAGLDLPFQSYGPFYNLLPGRAGRKALNQAQGVLWMGGLDLQDDSSLIKLIHTWLTFLSYQARGLKIRVLMQGAGPIRTSFGRVLTRRILALTEVFLARDPGTFRLLKGLSPGCDIRLVHDGIFAGQIRTAGIGRDESDYLKELTGPEEARPVIGFNLRMWFHFASRLLPYHLTKGSFKARAGEGMTRFSAAAKTLIQTLCQETGARILLISMYQPEVEPWEDDLNQLARLKDEFDQDREVVLLDRPLSIPAFSSLIGSLDLMVGTRLHSTLAAIDSGVPALNISYTLKGRDIFNHLGLADQVVDLEAFIDRPGETARLALDLLNDPQAGERSRAAARRAREINDAALQELFLNREGPCAV